MIGNFYYLNFNFRLRPEFLKNLKELKEFVIKNCGLKEMLGSTLNSNMYLSMVKSYVNSINSGGVPNISNAWESIMENQCILVYNQVNFILK